METNEFNVIKGDPVKRLSTDDDDENSPLLMAEWLKEPNLWDRSKFVNEVTETVASLGDASVLDRHIIAMLAIQMEIFVAAWDSIASEGLISQFNGGQTNGRSPYVAIADNSLKKVMLLMTELRLTPIARPRRMPSGRIAKFLKGP